VDNQTHHQKDNRIVENAKVHVPSVKQPQKSSCDGSHIQNLKGRQSMIYALYHSHVSICGMCTWAGLLNPPCRGWIKCFLCQQMGHVARHYEAKLKKVVNQGKSNHAPNYVVNKLSIAMQRIWIAKDVHAGGSLEANNLFLTH
jgi:hypothetical protein